jgi:hypothetical protein
VSVSDECWSPPCKGVVLPDWIEGVGVENHDAANCQTCRLPYRRELGVWIPAGPVVVTIWGDQPIRGDVVSFENGRLTLKPSDGSPARVIHARAELVEIVATTT